MQSCAGQRLGLTGGIGSGKSTVAKVLAECGAVLIDADAISRQVTAPGGAAIAPIAALFGPQAITSDGAMDRDVMRQLVFSDPARRRQLEAIIHPLVSLETKRLSVHALQGGSRCVVFDIPLLVESVRWRRQLDRVLVVDCLESTQIDRVMAREAAQNPGASGWTRETVLQVMAGQASRAQRLAAADLCIYNEGLPLEELSRKARQVAARFGL